MMFCRAAWQRLAPLALKTLSPLSNNVVPARQMSFGLPASAIPMSDLLRTVKIIAGSTAEIAAASIGDQHLVAAVRLAEERSSVETLNGVQVPDIKVGESVSEVSEKAGDEKTMSSGSDDEEVKNEGQELEELPSAPAAEDTATADYVELETEADKTVEPEVAVEDTASLEAAPEELAVDGEMVNDLALEMAVSSVLMLSEDDTISGVAEVTPATAEEDKASCHETAASEGITEPPAALEEALKVTRGAEGEVDVTETKLDAVEEAESAEAT